MVNIKTAKYLTILALIISTFNLMLVFQGVDMTDDGLFLINAQRSFPEPEIKTPVYGASTLFLTNYLAGAWLNLSDHPSIMHARIGSVLLITALTIIVFLSIVQIYPPSKAFFPVMASSMFLSVLQPRSINYTLIPAILTATAMLFLIKGLKMQKRGWLWLLLCGIALVADALSLFNLIVIVFALPFAFIIYGLYFKSQDVEKAGYWLFVGVASGVAGFMLLFQIIGYLPYYTVQIFNTIVKGFFLNNTDYFYGHAMNFTIVRYVMDFVRSVILVAVAGLGVYLIFTLQRLITFGSKSYSRKFISKHFLTLILAIIISGFALVMIYSPDFGRNVMLAASYCLAILVTIILLPTLVQKLLPNRISQPQRVPVDDNVSVFLITLLLFLWIIPTGSDDGLLRTFTGLWIILPLSIIIFSSNKINGKQTFSAFKNFLVVNSKLFLIMLAGFAVIYAAFMFPSIRDAPRYNLITPFSHPSLIGIYSTSDRVQAIEKILRVIENNTISGDRVLIVGDAPLFYYLTDTIPAYGEGWTNIETFDQIKRFELESDESRRKPKLAVFSKYFMIDPYWPTLKVSYTDKRDSLAIRDFLKEKYTKLEYLKIYEDDLFEVYGVKN